MPIHNIKSYEYKMAYKELLFDNKSLRILFIQTNTIFLAY